MKECLTRIYNIEYLLHNEFSDDDLKYLIDGHSFKYSMIAYELELAGKHIKNITQLKQILKTQNWQYRYFLTKKELIDVENKVKEVYKRLYYHSDAYSIAYAQMFMIQFGLSNIMVKNKIKQNIL